MKQSINKLFSLFSKKDKKFIIFLLFFSIFISIIETIGISAIMPFMSIATDFTLVDTNKYYSLIYNYFNFDSEVDFVVYFGFLLILFYIFRSAINLLYFYTLAKFTRGRYHILAYKLFENYMGMSYKNFVKKNTSTLTKSIINEASNLTSLISSVLFMMSEVFVIIFIYCMMLYVNYKITLLLTLVLVINAIFMTKTISKKIKKIGIKRAEIQKNFYEIINKSFGNFKLIKLNSNDKDIVDEFKESSSSFAKIAILNSTLSNVPRLFLEAIGFSIIVAIITYFVWKYNTDASTSLSVISMFVLSLYRLLPSVNRIMTNFNSIMFSHKALDIVHNDLMYPCEDFGNDTINFDQIIEIKNLSFEYVENRLVLNKINLKIKKGSKIAFVGESGSGKSTLVDIIIGLYKPVEGNIKIDNYILDDNNVKSWREKIGYIPQFVYLFDGTVSENVVFGREYNREKVVDVLKKARIYNFLLEKDGLDTFVGEGGIMLSGGQKQRIAIARALYADPEILVLDEATSALDDNTEKQIMNEIYDISGDKTLIMIAHRISTLDKCEKIYKLNNGELIID